MKQPLVYVVGLVLNYVDKSWSIVGVFTTEKEAIKNCKSEDHFVGPMPLDKAFHKPSEEWKGAWYPKLENKPSYEVSRPKKNLKSKSK